ncbi:MAG: hypothetical protein A3I24_01455 [Candidatus Harrisonbacteria bacterium RIFCSPLOWO2_02_FULL_41_13b]|uniref:Uncharacterized protein n=1 Tax=Candidatus Harrisonbacteria bacterium RIFCSPLOWO2_02_FULL_41_13b TaxID=1798409 RepID=A0A1G1ZTE2_9BACT|nr:MAG: hypothetical protein A3J53_02095 [Candidatus Harrisonbacteria bacterium RIFCSPHIGHO2_02_FULL_40_20]OGY67822.1 MAG: hypothetical protein A3I24_01455 [Candidatus Harrisonbacteria bacterium RIFCSPLOWO2_02_FULL_41_13b]
MTRKRVNDAQYGALWRRLKEVARRVDEETLSFERTMTELQEIIELDGQVITVFINPAKPFLQDMTQEGWELLKDVKYEAGEVQLELKEFLKPGETSVKGDVMAERAIELNANLGQKHAEYLLENQHLIPVEFRKFYLTFPGTVWQVSDGRFVPYLYWRGERWFLNFFWLERDWDGLGRLLSLRKPACR